MRFSQETYDGIARRLAGQNPNMLVPWFLMASHAYYDLDDPFLTDGCYDWLCTELDANWDQVEHDHKRLIDRDALKAGTGYTLAGKMPTRIVNAARHLMHAYDSPAEIAPVCRYCDGSGWFYSEPDLGPCSCSAGKKKAVASIDDLLGEPSRLEVNGGWVKERITSGIEDLL